MTRKENPGQNAKRVLIIKLSALGDFVMSLGAAKAVRNAHPNAEITLLTTPMLRELAATCPYFDRVETDGRPKGLRAQYDLLNRISKTRYGIVYDFQTSNRTNTYWKLLKRLPNFRAPYWSGAVEGQAFFHANPKRHTMHPIDRLADQLRDAGHVIRSGEAPVPDLKWVRQTAGDKPELQPSHFGINGKFALLIPGASAHRSAKRWPEDRYAALASYLADLAIDPVIIGGPSEAEIAADITRLEPRAKNIVGKTSLFQIVTLAEQASVAIGNDTGPMHMSTLAGAKGVALFATDESSPVQACPRGAPVKTVSAPRADGIDLKRVLDATSVMLTHGDVPKRQLLETLHETDCISCELKLLDGQAFSGHMLGLHSNGETFSFSAHGPLASKEDHELNIADLDPYSIRYWTKTSNHAIDLVV